MIIIKLAILKSASRHHQPHEIFLQRMVSAVKIMVVHVRHIVMVVLLKNCVCVCVCVCVQSRKVSGSSV